VIEQAGQRHGQSQVETLTIEFVEPGSVTTALVPLRMAKKTRSLPRHRAGRPRTLARRSRVSPPQGSAQSHRSTDYRAGDPHASKGQVAEMVVRISVIQSKFCQRRHGC
jgi:hypothetical protein